MSIRVNNFQWDPGRNDREYIKLLEEARDAWKAIAQKAISKLKQQATGEQRYDDGFEDGVMFISERIDAAPTIDAIPVEWLQKKRKYASEGDSLDVGIAEVLNMWKKEQEVG